MSGYVPVNIGGVLTPSHVQKIQRGSFAGLLLRGVVLNVFYVDDANFEMRHADPPEGSNRNIATPQAESAERRHVYARVLVYSDIPELRKLVLDKVLVPQPGGGKFTGDIWVPRPTFANDENTATATIMRSPLSAFDGDHVLVGFIDNDRFLPVIIGSLPHPSRDTGLDGYGSFATGTRLYTPVNPTQIPRLVKHAGVVYGVDGRGNFTVDATRGHTGLLDRNGREPRLPGDDSESSTLTVPVDGTSGNVDLRLRAGSALTVTVYSDAADAEATTTRKTLLSMTNGTVTLAVAHNADDPAATPSVITIDADGITIDAQDDVGEVVVKGSKADLQTDEVDLGDAATHPVVHGDTYNSLHTQLDAALTQFLTVVQAQPAALTAAAATVAGTTEAGQIPTLWGALLASSTALQAAALALTTAVQAFEGSVQTALSTDVKSR